MNGFLSRLVFFALGSLGSVTAAGPGVDGVDHVRTVAGIAEYVLPANGLTVLLLEDHSAPVLTLMVTYRVGSRNEVTGTTGATHLLEHLMFKGSRNFHPGIGKGFDTLLDRIGGINNATTWLDRTNYYENLPSQHLELAVQLEADRMRHLLLREEDRQMEMTVVRNEFERDENDPASTLDKEVTAAAFIAHPYHHPTIGWRSDIEKVSIEKLREFYDTFYWPNNAVVSVIGDFQPAATLRLLQRHFGAIPRSPKPIPATYTEEPPQTGPRRVLVRRPGEVGAVQIAYKSPSARHPDHAPLEVLAEILSSGKTSRLYRALLDTNLAISAVSTKGFFHDEFLFNTTALLAPGATHEQVEKVMLAEFTKVRDAGVEPAEVERAINKLLAGIAFGRDGSFAIAGQLNEAIAVGDWTLYSVLPARLRAVSPADVQRVAQTYLVEPRSTTGWFVPQADATGKTAGTTPRPEAGARPTAPARGPHYYRDPATTPAGRNTPTAAAAPATAGAPGTAFPAIAPRIQRRTVAGFDVLTLKTAIPDVITLRGVVGGGTACNPPGNSAIADLTAGMLDQGTVQRDKFAIAALLEQTGATLTFAAGSHALNFSAKCLRKDVAVVLSLLAEQLRTPRFDSAEFAKLKKQLAGSYRRQMEEPEFRAQIAFTRAVFPEGHPNRRPAEETYLADLERATLEEVRAFHATHFGPAGGARLVAVGDVDDGTIDRTLAQVFGGWTGGRALPASPPAPALAASRTEKIPMPDKTSVAVLLGQPSGLRHADPAHSALSLGTAVFGSGFFSARLLDIIRNREGLTYGIGASLIGDTYTDGAWLLQGTFGPDLLEKGLTSTLRELRRFCRDGLTAEEVATFKVTLTGSFQVALATTDGLASTILTSLQRGHGPDWVDDYPRRVSALTLEEVNAAVRRYLDPDRMVTVLAGNLGTAPGK